MGRAVKWAVEYGTLRVEEYDSFEDAAWGAVNASEMGTEALRRIEYAGKSYDLDSPEVEAACVTRRDKMRATAELGARDARDDRYTVDVRDDESNVWVTAVETGDVEQAAEMAIRYASVLGDNRVLFMYYPGDDE